MGLNVPAKGLSAFLGVRGVKIEFRSWEVNCFLDASCDCALLDAIGWLEGIGEEFNLLLLVTGVFAGGWLSTEALYQR